jgi:cell division septation protein DedD
MRCKYLLGAVLLIATAAPLSAQSVRAGIDAWQQSDYAGAVAIWRPLAEKGDADAQFNLGQAYRLGRGVPTNLSAAKTWFERAASQGHVDAQTTLGLMLFQNGDQAEGLRWLKKAAEQGEPRALLVYGTALVNGDTVTQDRVLGYAYVSRAAAQGLEPAKDTLDQLDQILPLVDRKRGVAMARDMVKAAPAPKSEPKQLAAKAGRTASTRSPSDAAPKPAKPPKPRPDESAPAAGAWRIQLGAFSKQGSAEALYRRLAGKSALSGRRPFYVPAGGVTRLQVGPFESRAAAQAACSALGVACLAVSAK